MGRIQRYMLRYFWLASSLLAVSVSFAQNPVDTLIRADSAVYIYLSNSDTIVIEHTDTVVVLNQTAEGGKLSKKSESSTANTEDKVDPKSVLKVISVGKIIWSIIFLVFTYFIIRGVSKLLNVLAERSARYRITVKGFIPIIRVLGWILAIYIVIGGVINPPAETIIAVAASIGIAVGFAAQDILRNVFGGFIIIFDRPFKVGDKVEIDKYYGEVVEIGLRSTQIVTPDDSLVSVPNGEMMNRAVSNANAGEPNCQVVAEIYLPVTIDTDLVRKIAMETAQVSKYIYLNKPIRVLFFNEIHQRRSYLKMRLKAYVLDIRDEFNFKSDMTEIVLKELISQKVVKPEDLF
jgi:small-conductance mechanosensitive channel